MTCLMVKVQPTGLSHSRLAGNHWLHANMQPCAPMQPCVFDTPCCILCLLSRQQVTLPTLLPASKHAANLDFHNRSLCYFGHVSIPCADSDAICHVLS